MSTESLEDLLRNVDPVSHLRNSSRGPNVYPQAVAREYTNWRSETLSWHQTCSLLNQTHHMFELEVKGPDALALLSHVAINSLANLGPGRAKQLVACTPAGNVLGDVILFPDDGNGYHLAGRPAVLNWLTFHAETGDWDVELELDPPSTFRTDGQRKHYRFQVQGPHAMKVIEKAIGRPPADLKIFEMNTETIAGRRANCLRHGMAGKPGWEIYGAIEDHDPVLEALLAAGEEFDMQRIGTLAYSTTPIESGWIPSPIPAVYTGAELEEYRRWLPADGHEGTLSIGGSFLSDDIEDYYLTPWDLGYDRYIKFDHDFIGREALEQKADGAHRVKVALAMDDDEMARTFAGYFNAPGQRPKFIEWPTGVYAMHPFDEVTVDGKPVGISTWFAYSSNAGKMMSLAILEPEHAEPGTEVKLVWGEENGGTSKPTVERHVQVEIGAVVEPTP